MISYSSPKYINNCIYQSKNLMFVTFFPTFTINYSIQFNVCRLNHSLKTMYMNTLVHLVPMYNDLSSEYMLQLFCPINYSLEKNALLTLLQSYERCPRWRQEAVKEYLKNLLYFSRPSCQPPYQAQFNKVTVQKFTSLCDQSFVSDYIYIYIHDNVPKQQLMNKDSEGKRHPQQQSNKP